jgi:hypothetical protein
MKYAWIENNKIRDIVDSDPFSIFHADVASNYSTQVADTIEDNAELVNGVWVNPVTPEPDPNFIPPEPEKVYTKVTPIEFKMLFTVQERIAIKTAKATDEILTDGFDILDDARLTEVDLGLTSVQELLAYLVSLELLTALRVEEILSAKLV